MENKKSMNIVVAVVIVLALIVAIIFISINNKTKMVTDNSGASSAAGNPPASGDNANTPPSVAQADPTQIGMAAKSGDTVAMNYTGRLADGTVFDSNVDPKFQHVQPFVFTLGAGQVIPGWDKGIVGMKVGEKKTLTIPPEDAYGAAGSPPAIPPNATLIFDVELLGIKT